jgi:hypothetical protein
MAGVRVRLIQVTESAGHICQLTVDGLLQTGQSGHQPDHQDGSYDDNFCRQNDTVVIPLKLFQQFPHCCSPVFVRKNSAREEPAENVKPPHHRLLKNDAAFATDLGHEPQSDFAPSGP